MTLDATKTNLESELAELLDELSDVQRDLLTVLEEKRECMANGDMERMTALHPQTEALCDRLQSCHDRRQALLASAEQQGVPGETLQQLATGLPRGTRDAVSKRMLEASSRMRLLQHHSLTNWVLAQRTILHLSQMLEIIATGGRLQPTYSREGASDSCGALVDREV